MIEGEPRLHGGVEMVDRLGDGDLDLPDGSKLGVGDGDTVNSSLLMQGVNQSFRLPDK